MIKNKTAVNSRKVTRTIEVMNLTVTCINLEDKTVLDIPVSIPAVGYRSTKALEMAITKAVTEKSPSYKYVTHTISDKMYITYAMPESQFLSLATPIATGNDIKNMIKITDATDAELVEENAEEITTDEQ